MNKGFWLFWVKFNDMNINPSNLCHGHFDEENPDIFITDKYVWGDNQVKETDGYQPLSDLKKEKYKFFMSENYEDLKNVRDFIGSESWKFRKEYIDKSIKFLDEVDETLNFPNVFKNPQFESIINFTRKKKLDDTLSLLWVTSKY